MVSVLYAVSEETKFSFFMIVFPIPSPYLALSTDFTTLGTATTVSFFAFPKHFSPQLGPEELPRKTDGVQLYPEKQF